MKFVLAYTLCSAITGLCNTTMIHPTTFNSWSECAKDGTPSFSIVQPKPFDDYYLQTAFYHFATKLEPYLLIVNEDSYKIYTQENCYELQQENLKRIALKIRHTCLRRERLAERHAGKTTWTNDIPLDLSNFKWDDEYKNTAENIWNENLLTSTK
jgi:hypothetical protein